MRDQPRDTLILLHGLWMGGWTMAWLAHALREAGFETRVLSYHSMTQAPQAHLEALAREVSAAPGRRVHLLGHSMGGVLVLDYLGAGADPRLARALLLATPATGCQAARDLERHTWGRMLLGESLGLWRAAAPGAIDPGLEIGAIAGDAPFGLGALFLSLPSPNDGVVTVEETRLPALRDHCVLPVSHTGMLLSSEVARQAAAFLARGRFER
ncbi:MAG: alpha/beta fold hydrolase [Burkholderiales bacterium]|nr:alpha/beta fold hydrolase [Burkholderiales bacterium]